MENRLPIHIAYCVNNAYVPYIAVSIRSVADSHRHTPVHVHILSDDITPASRTRLLREVEGFPQIELHFYQVDDSALSGLEAWSKYTWYRLLLQANLPADVGRVLYLDADTLVCDDLSPLFEMDMADAAVAGVIDPMGFDGEAYSRCGYPREKGYVCAGVLLINLEHWRRADLASTMIQWGLQHVEIRYHDQDVINHICRDSKIMLPLRYGVVDSLFVLDDTFRPPYLGQVEDALLRPAVIHYAGTAPWLRDAAVHPLHDRWHRVNSTLKEPAPRSYRSTGLLRLKVMLWNLLHPGIRRMRVSTEAALKRAREAGARNSAPLTNNQSPE